MERKGLSYINRKEITTKILLLWDIFSYQWDFIVRWGPTSFIADRRTDRQIGTDDGQAVKWSFPFT